jgi:hypothetical protein
MAATRKEWGEIRMEILLAKRRRLSILRMSLVDIGDVPSIPLQPRADKKSAPFEHD